MEKPLGQQMEVANYFCFISFGINQINDGIKNKKYKLRIKFILELLF